MSNRPAQLADPSPGKLCPECGYDLRGIASQQCPECGLNLNDPNYSSIPWANRARIGHFKAFWKTALLATFRPKKLGMAVAQPVDFRSANRFRWIVVVLATLPAVVTVVVVKTLDDASGWRIARIGDLSKDAFDMRSGLLPALTVIFGAGLSLAPVIPLGALVMFALWTASAGIWFRPRRMTVVEQNRAIAISRYACAPLAWLPIAGLGAIPIAVLAYFNANIPAQFGWLIITIGLVVELFLLAILIASWWGTLRLLSMTTRCGWGRWSIAAIGIPAGWIVSASIGMLLVPCIAGFISIVIESLK
ncbi:MAG TPA: hypothetical protein VH370_00545 [Humisphaera sp.]|nr:hypothetical protein [Humisphaera sp.]